MAVDINDVTKRWDEIRNNEECNLSLEPEFVSQFVKRKESELVKEKIRETLTHLAKLRLTKGKFASDDPAAPGDIVICEGIEAFLIPAVEKALPLSEFLAEYDRQTDLVDAFVEDINELLKIWGKTGFEGRPYLNPDGIMGILEPSWRGKAKNLDTTESAAIACRVIIHLLTLYLNKDEESYFAQIIGEKIKIDLLRKILSNAISFLVDAFQKGKGDDIKTQIGNAVVGTTEGSGWSWTSWPGLPPMLFFTSIAVDAFAELELYLIRKVKRSNPDEILTRIYKENEEKLLEYQFCVDMARRWVGKSILPYISTGLGVYPEKFSDGSMLEFNIEMKGYELFKSELDRVEGLKDSPLVFYNNLYALLILLWSFGDWDDSAKERNKEIESMIERSIMQVVNNYTRINVVSEVLNRFPYKFYLPGKNFFIEGSSKEERAYMDSGFLTLLTRQLVLCAVYGIGDPSVLGNLVESLYIELLLNRNREDPQYAYLWSIKKKEIFSTQRAVQALTFYYAYAKGKEVDTVEDAPLSANGGQCPSAKGGKTINIPLQLQIPENIDWSAIFSGVESSIKAWENKNEKSKPQPPELTLTATNFAEYIKEKKIKAAKFVTDEQQDFLMEIDKVGNDITDSFHHGHISYKDTISLLEDASGLLKTPLDQDGSILKNNLDKIKSEYEKLVSRRK
jgi:hypothetical protein